MVALDFPDSPVDGQAFDMFVYDGTRQVWNIEGTRLYPTIEYLVIAGGGAGGHGYQTNNDWAGGGGGAGGYRSSVSGESSGGGASAETPLSVTVGASYTVTIGAGAAGQINTAAVEPPGGSNSVFGSIVSIGGGSGAGIRQFVEGGYPATVVCGSGGGAYRSTNTPGYGTANQGFDGGLGGSGIRSSGSSGGGGGAGEAGDTDGQGQGGDGVSSSITGSAVVRGGGGGGGATSIRLGGDGGGGNGSTGSSPVAGTVNTGGGGGGRFGLSSSVPGASGGSGIVILRYPSWMSLTVGAGLTSSTATVGSNKVTTFTAGSDTVTVGV